MSPFVRRGDIITTKGKKLMRISEIQCLMYLVTLKMLQNINKRINDKLIQVKLTLSDIQ